MRRSLHTDEEIAFLLDEAARGIPIAAICASAHVSLGTFYRWRRRLGGLKPAGVARLDQVERENAGLRAEVLRLRAACSSAGARGTGHDGAREPEPAAAPSRRPSLCRRFAFGRSAN